MIKKCKMSYANRWEEVKWKGIIDSDEMELN
jgi:hypothetical protein